MPARRLSRKACSKCGKVVNPLTHRCVKVGGVAHKKACKTEPHATELCDQTSKPHRTPKRKSTTARKRKSTSARKRKPELTALQRRAQDFKDLSKAEFQEFEQLLKLATENMDPEDIEELSILAFDDLGVKPDYVTVGDVRNILAGKLNEPEVFDAWNFNPGDWRTKEYLRDQIHHIDIVEFADQILRPGANDDRPAEFGDAHDALLPRPLLDSLRKRFGRAKKSSRKSGSKGRKRQSVRKSRKRSSKKASASHLSQIIRSLEALEPATRNFSTEK